MLTPVIDRVYPLAETAEAMRHLEAGHVRGKVVITMGQREVGQARSASPYAPR